MCVFHILFLQTGSCSLGAQHTVDRVTAGAKVSMQRGSGLYNPLCLEDLFLFFFRFLIQGETTLFSFSFCFYGY